MTRREHPRGRRALLAVGITMTLTSLAVVIPAEIDVGAAQAPIGVDAVLDWNQRASEAMITSGISPTLDPLHESRLFAMMHLAMHDALNGIVRRSAPYALDITPVPGADPRAAAITAAHDVLVPGLEQLPLEFAAGIPAAVAQIETAYQDQLAAIPDSKAKRQGVTIGRAAAAVINARRVDDGADEPFLDPDYPQIDQPGQFRFVEGAPFAVAPTWAEVTPFAMRSGDQFRPRPPYDIASRKYANDFNELKAVGSINSTTRSSDQTEAAFFWFENSPLHWNRIARTVAADAHLDMWDNARLFGLLNLVEADGYIGNWEAKNHYNRWRPETAVRLADTDGNPLTRGDATWTPLWGSSGATPEYDSGHTIEGASAAVVLASVLGTDDVTFRSCSYTFQHDATTNCDGASPIYRTFHSFSAAATENGLSRIWIGWHFRSSVDAGYQHGQQLGRYVVRRFLVELN